MSKAAKEIMKLSCKELNLITPFVKPRDRYTPDASPIHNVRLIPVGDCGWLIYGMDGHKMAMLRKFANIINTPQVHAWDIVLTPGLTRTMRLKSAEFLIISDDLSATVYDKAYQALGHVNGALINSDGTYMSSLDSIGYFLNQYFDFKNVSLETPVTLPYLGPNALRAIADMADAAFKLAADVSKESVMPIRFRASKKDPLTSPLFVEIYGLSNLLACVMPTFHNGDDDQGQHARLALNDWVSELVYNKK